ncbi:siderophore-interacting protein [Pseudonocardia spinosispora]|uniref:siderophore-interacting protein n=1 Tax=Pseudonocardia spinosispora TaxID=103441 RepID=UPI00040A4234|nr:siderophore-interacting protein [Pseudonocardia spinosispora]
MTGDDAHLAEIAQVKAGSSYAKVPYPVGLCELEVLETRMIGSGLMRLTLGGEGAEGFQSHVPEEHIRLIFPDENGELRLPEKVDLTLRWPRPLPVSREYTVRDHDPVGNRLDLDIALHPGGVASDWVQEVKPGDRIHVAGPPGGVVVSDSYRRYLFGGDISALPQIARWLEMLPGNAVGWAFIEVADESEEIDVTGPPGVEVRWVHRDGVPIGQGDALERAIRGVEIPEGERIFVWIAAEAGVLKPLRRWARDELGLDQKDVRITGYWKRGVADFDDED